MNKSNENIIDDKCRLDKWLWAARFYKTRSLSADAIDSGKVRVDGERIKPAKEVKMGQSIAIRSKDVEIEVTVLGLSIIRRGAPDAVLLYAETEMSKLKREQVALARDADIGNRERGAGRPTKRQQRDIKKFTGIY